MKEAILKRDKVFLSFNKVLAYLTNILVAALTEQGALSRRSSNFEGLPAHGT